MRPADRRWLPPVLALFTAIALPAVAAADFTPASGSPIALGSPNEIEDIAAGTMDAGDTPDLVAISYGEHVFVLLGDGSGAFSEASGSPFTETAGGVNGEGLTLGDFNGDGKLDAARAATDFTIIDGNGDGTLTVPGTPFPPSMSFPPGECYTKLAAGRVNAGASLDLVAMDGCNYGVRMFSNNGSGTFATGDYGSARPGNEAADITLADFNGDGKLDAATANGATNDVSVLLGDGAGNFPDATAANVFSTGATVGRASALAAGDLNGDGHFDVVTANGTDNSVSAMLGNGAGVLTTPTSTTGTGGTQAADVALADVNDDGRLDALVANSGSSDLSVLLGDGHGGFTPATYSPVALGANNPGAVVVTDFNGDGEADVATGNASNSISVLLNTNHVRAAVLGPSSTLDFGSHVIGSSTVRQATLANTGTQFLHAATVALSGPHASDFQIVSDGCSHKTVFVGSSCAVDLAFKPTVASGSSATLTVTDDAAGSPRSITLTGTGVNPPPQPQVTGFKMRPSRFRRARFATPVSARKHRVPRGSSFRYSLSADASVKITITQLRPGRRVAGRCLRPTPRLRSKHACTRSRKRGVLTRHGLAGANKVPFSGRIGRRALPAGRYRAKIVASVPGAKASAPRSVRFTILPG
jgi:hypothetical protein